MCYPLIQRTLSGLARAVRPHIFLLAFLYYSERTTARPELWAPTADCWPHQATYEICVEASPPAPQNRNYLFRPWLLFSSFIVVGVGFPNCVLFQERTVQAVSRLQIGLFF